MTPFEKIWLRTYLTAIQNSCSVEHSKAYADRAWEVYQMIHINHITFEEYQKDGS